MDQVIFTSSFLFQYQSWWDLGNSMSQVADFEFAVLILRICSYATHFLPSKSHLIDGIRGMTLSQIRDLCTQVADDLTASCAELDGRGSLSRIQHLIFAGLAFMCEGKMNASYDKLNLAIRAGQQLGIQRDPSSVCSARDGDIDELEKEMRRRTYCNLYIWDRYVLPVLFKHTSK